MKTAIIYFGLLLTFTFAASSTGFAQTFGNFGNSSQTFPEFKETKTFTSFGGGFSINLPIDFRDFTEEKHFDANGNFTDCSFRSGVTYQNYRFALSINYSIIDPSDQRAALQLRGNSIEQELKNFDVVLLSKENITFSGNPGIVFTGTRKPNSTLNKVYIQGVYTVAGSKLYQILLLANEKQYVDPPKIQAIFKSFKFII